MWSQNLEGDRHYERGADLEVPPRVELIEGPYQEVKLVVLGNFFGREPERVVRQEDDNGRVDVLRDEYDHDAVVVPPGGVPRIMQMLCDCEETRL